MVFCLSLLQLSNSYVGGEQTVVYCVLAGGLSEHVCKHYHVVLGAAHILGKMEHAKISHGLWQLCAVQVEHLNKVRQNCRRHCFLLVTSALHVIKRYGGVFHCCFVGSIT